MTQSKLEDSQLRTSGRTVERNQVHRLESEIEMLRLEVQQLRQEKPKRNREMVLGDDGELVHVES
jgi:hypothetical protein